MEQDIRLVYGAASNQVRVSFPAESVKEDRRPPKGLYKRAKAKLEDELGKGNIETFVIYENGFNQFWSHLRGQEDLGNKNALFCIAQGFRNYKDILVRQQGDTKEWSMTLNASAETLQKIGWPRFNAFVLKQMGFEPYAQSQIQARIQENYWRALRGEKIQNRVLAQLLLDELPPMKFSQDKTHGTILLWINSAELIQSSGHKRVLSQVQSFLEKNKATLPDYGDLNKECAEVLKELSAMPESFGFGLPVGLPVAIKSLAAVAAKQEAAAGTAATKDVFKNTRPAPRPAAEKARLSEKLIEIEVADDQLEAHITWADDAKLQNGTYDTDTRWLEVALQEAGIRYGTEMYVEKILNLITLGQSIKNQTLARGIPPKAGEQTYLHPLYLEKSLDDTDNVIDLRSAQNKRVVETGDVIAEIRFRDGKSGMNIFGKALHATIKQTSYVLDPGPGVERRDDGRFYALLRGVPKIERHVVSCLNVYVHLGDVNMKTGDINFDGSVEVKGNIDNGARVYAKGDLIVRGGIGRARIRCKGDISVAKGIVTSREGMVHAGGDVNALFIENSRLLVEGALEVEQSIINSDCKVQGEVVIRSPTKGLIGGGTLVSETGIRTHDIGFADGEKTICHVGSDWRLEHRLTILRGREIKLKKFVTDRQYEFDDMTRKKAVSERLQKVERRLIKSKKILDRIEKLSEAIRNRLRWNDMAVLVVRGICDPNVEITIGGRVVGVPKSVREVMFTAVRYRDQYVNALVYLEQYKKSRMNDAI